MISVFVEYSWNKMETKSDLSDKMKFVKPSRSNVEIGDFCVNIHFFMGYTSEGSGAYTFTCIDEIVAVGENFIVYKYSGDVMETSFDEAIVLKKNGTYLAGKNPLAGKVRNP